MGEHINQQTYLGGPALRILRQTQRSVFICQDGSTLSFIVLTVMTHPWACVQLVTNGPTTVMRPSAFLGSILEDANSTQKNMSWLVVEPPLWKILVSWQLELLFPTYGNMKNVWKHQADITNYSITRHLITIKSPLININIPCSSLLTPNPNPFHGPRD